MLVIIAVSVFLSMLKLPTSAHTVRGKPTVKELIERFWTGSVYELKENAKAVPKNLKETSENNTDIEMDLHILGMHSNVIQTCSSVHSPDKRLTAGHSNLNIQKPNSWSKQRS